VIDNSGCNALNLNVVHVDFEADTSLSAGNGVTTIYGCPSATAPQLFLNYEEVNDNQSSGGGQPFIYQTPANDADVDLTITNSNDVYSFTGIPSLQRYNLQGSAGYVPFLAYAPSGKSTGGSSASNAPFQLIGDLNVSQLWQYGIRASDFLYSDPFFAALSNGTTLFAGQILAPPSYWSGANGKRYALDVVYQTGTTGTPNGGATTCTGTSGTGILTCSSATDLSAGQRISIGTDTNKTISSVNASNPSAVQVNLASNLASAYSTGAALSFSAPVLGPEIQMPTKSAASPATLAWSQGDMEQNSGAAANGVAAWVNVAGGTPGTWAGVPLGNSSGQIAPSQISSTTGSGSVVLAASPTFTGNVTTFANGAASQDYLVLQPGTGGTDQIGAFEFANNAGTSEWEIRKDAGNTFRIRDTANSVDRQIQYAGGQTEINSGGSASVAINNTSTSGTGGFIVYEGGSNYNTAAFTVTNAGNASVPGGLTSSAMTDTGLTTAGLVTTTSGGVLGSVATTGTGSAVLATSPTVSGLTNTGTESVTTLNVSGATTLANVTLNGSCTGTGCTQTGTPAWLMYLGTGADGSYEWSSTGSCSTSPTHCYTGCTSSAPCNLSNGEYFATQWQVDAGAYVYENVASAPGLVVHATGACNDYGTILVNGAKSTWVNNGVGGGGGGGSGGGTAAGTAGKSSFANTVNATWGTTDSGTAGAASGGNGGSGSSFSTLFIRAMTNANAGGLDGLYLTGSPGAQGGSSGGVLGYPGGGMVQMCSSISGTSGVIDASGAYGMPPSANSTGAGSGGGGGVVILSSRSTVTTWPTVYVAGGPGGLVTVPEALGTSGSCTTQPKATLGVTSGALNGTCTVVQAGAGCGTGTNVTFNVVGGGGTLGTGTVNPTWSGGALASCTTTAGTSSGYTSATYTTAGTGGDGGNGWYTEFQGW